MKRGFIALLLLVSSLAVQSQSYVYNWYPGINQRTILSNKYIDSLRIRIVKPMGLHGVRYDIDIYTISKAVMITHGNDSSGWVGSKNKGPFIRGYVHFLNGKQMFNQYPCDSIPIGHLDEWYNWHGHLEDCNDYLRYTIESYSNEEFTIHFNRHEFNKLYLYVHATPLNDRAEAKELIPSTYNVLGQLYRQSEYDLYFPIVNPTK